MRPALALIVALVACTGAASADVTGRASVIDGDSAPRPARTKEVDNVEDRL